MEFSLLVVVVAVFYLARLSRRVTHLYDRLSSLDERLRAIERSPNRDRVPAPEADSIPMRTAEGIREPESRESHARSFQARSTEEPGITGAGKPHATVDTETTATSKGLYQSGEREGRDTSRTPISTGETTDTSRIDKWTGEPVDDGADKGPPVQTEPDFADTIRRWLLGGNTVARVGIVILFLGIAFLLKLAVDRGWLPIELRLAGAALAGLALIAVGWRLREKRLTYALVLEGGGVGIVYLTVYAAVNIYALVATLPGMALMVALVLLSSALAVLQNARSLALLATAGGFLAPVILSQESNHVVLFSYYSALNAGILTIAWFKAWRELNLVGFVFTFVIGGIWGYEYYQPEYFATTEPFLILFFLLYVAVPVLFARRQALTRGEEIVDASLIFGVPLVVAALQGSLVYDFEFGLAFSALAMGLFYALLAIGLWRGRNERKRMLTETFLALAVVFGTIAVPLAVDGHWTSAIWALEGSALVWVGIRQNRVKARVFGFLVQFGAGMLFLGEGVGGTEGVPVLNRFYLGAAIVSAAGLISGLYLWRNRKELVDIEISTPAVLTVWGLVWWFAAGINEISRYVEEPYKAASSLVFVTLSMVAVNALRRRFDWVVLEVPPLLLLPTMVVAALYTFEELALAHPLAAGGVIAWPLAFLLQYWLARWSKSDWLGELRSYWTFAAYWLAAFLASWEASWLVERATLGPVWSEVVWALTPAFFIVAAPRLYAGLPWSAEAAKKRYLRTAPLPLVAVLGFWTLLVSAQKGSPHPLPYVPVLNPLELAQCLVLGVLIWWGRKKWLALDEKPLWYVWTTLLFVTLNGMIARSTHFFGGVPFEPAALWHSPVFQSALSITWTIAALTIMVAASRFRRRPAWLAGVGLLSGVVFKLMLVDLADIGTIPRIVSFVVVGLLILLIGYFSPLPPKNQEDDSP